VTHRHDRRIRCGLHRHRTSGLALTGALILAAGCSTAASGHINVSRPQGPVRVAGARRAVDPGGIIAPPRDQSGWRVSYPIKMPAGYDAPSSLVADASGRSVWFFAQGRVDGRPRETLFEWSVSSGGLRAYPIDNSDRALEAGAWTPIVVDRSGRAWLGINSTLVIFRPDGSRARLLALPPVKVGNRKRGLPGSPGPDPGRHANIDALALGPGGSIDVARAFATELQSVNPRTLHVRDITLPTDSAIAGLGEDIVSGAGVVAAVLYKGTGVHELGQYTRRSWSISDRPCAAYGASASGSVLVVSGPNCVERGTILEREAATMSRLHVPSFAGLPHPAIASSPSTILSATRHGLAVTKAGRSVVISLGKIKVREGPPSGGGPSPPARAYSASKNVDIVPGLMSSIGNGEAWFVPEPAGRVIGLVQFDGR
jgi:hypothetical protein